MRILMIGMGLVSLVFGIWLFATTDGSVCNTGSSQTRQNCLENSRNRAFLGMGAMAFGGGLLVVGWKIAKEESVEESMSNPHNTHYSGSGNTFSSSGSTEAELQRAKKMLDDGLIDEEEFKAMKKKIIDRS